MDTRELQSGKIRLRFRLTEDSMRVVEKAISSIKCKYPNTAIELICMDYLSGINTRTRIKANGPCRFLVRLYPEQYEIVKIALEEAMSPDSCEEDALCHICTEFLKENVLDK